ncbi:NB-ARC domain-containing protein [Streptomyces sp. TLI_146]|uniref:NB-ARC domain-containing protein n=1 Tax=Streptomyces sp. TLI_146 TaxID=1938858 RepID=UPI000C706085|nr:NB-ARC domain-containing protein [Streptomyces sp. TLI_146]PKV82734.1 WD-40 repeat-containing protein [Streptomyces sp. TLI_146]
MVDRPKILAELLARLTGGLPNTAKPSTVALIGAGGFGKTTLAIQALNAPEILERFPGGAWWTRLGQNATGPALAAKVNDIYARISGRRALVTDPEQAGLELGDMLDRCLPTLLVIDDVWHAGQLSPFLSGGDRCTRLVTTRVRDALRGDVWPMRVDEMSSEETGRLITHGVHLALDAAETEHLVRTVGRWPLLASLVNAQLRIRTDRGAAPHEAAEAVLSVLREHGPSGIDEQDPPGIDEHQARARAVRLTIEAGLRLLGSDLSDRFLELGIFPEDTDIHRDVLALLWGRTAGLSSAQTAAACAEFAALSLVADAREKPPLIRLHDVIRDYARAELGVRQADIHEVLLEAAANTLPSEDDNTAWWKIPVRAEYWWQHLVHHMAQAQQPQPLEALVTEPRWMLARLHAYGPAAVESDLTHSTSLLGPRLRHLIAQNAHLLAPCQPSHALSCTLLARLEAVPSIDTTPGWAGLGHPYLRPHWLLPDHVSHAVLRTLSGHRGAVRGCAFHPGGTILATSGEDGLGLLWDIRDGRQLHVLDPGGQVPLRACAFHPDGTLLLTVGHGGTARLWHVASAEPAGELIGHHGIVHTAAFSPDGTLAVTGGADRTVRIWRLPSKERAHVLRGHPGAVLDCAISPDGNVLATVGGDRSVRLWHLSSGEPYDELRPDDPARLTACAFSADGHLLASGDADGAVRLWDWASGRQVNGAMSGHEAVTACDFSPADPLLAAVGTGGQSAWLWNRMTRQETRIAHGTGKGSQSWACAYSPDGSQLATGDQDGSVRLWNPYASAIAHDILGRRRAMDAVVFTPDGTALVTTNVGGSTSIWNASEGGLLTELDTHARPGTPCAVSPDGRHLGVVDDDGTAGIYERTTGARLHRLADPAYDIGACTFTCDGGYLVTGGSRGTITLWRVADGQAVGQFSAGTSFITACCFSPNGTLFATAHVGGVNVWDWATRSQLRTHFGTLRAIPTCAFSPDGMLLAVAGEDRSVRFWRATSGKRGRKVIRYPTGLPSCAFNPVSGLLATAGHDGTITVWDLDDDTKPVAGTRVALPVGGCAWSPEGHRLAAAGQAGLYLFDFVQRNSR